jgi:hypothetical protein
MHRTELLDAFTQRLGEALRVVQLSGQDYGEAVAGDA